MKSKPTFGFQFYGLILLLGLGTYSDSRAAGKCDGDSAKYHIMPKTIGRPNEIFKSPYALPCDSMLVPEGQTTTIYSASMVHFGPNPSLASRIVVKGKLLVEGKAENPTYFSGSVKQTELGYVPGTQVWDGIEVDSGAVVRFDHARIFNAPTAMLVYSKDVVLEDCYFQGASGIILLDKNLLLNTQGHTIDVMDLRNGVKETPKATAKSSEPKKDSGSRAKKPGSIRNALYTAGGVGLLAATGVTWFALSSHSKPAKPPETGSNLDSDPELPTPVPLKP